MTTTVYTDGACVRNPGPGGWAWAIPGGLYQSGAAEHTTNQRMEIAAVLEALRANDGAVEVVSDSTYVVNCFRDRWWEGWLARDWKNAAKKPVMNRDLWEPLIELYRKRASEIAFRWVKGHATDRTNDLVDRLAVEAAQTQQGRSGTGFPNDLGAADIPGSRDPRLPEGHLVVVAGAKPPELGGYGDTQTAARVRKKLVEILRAKRDIYQDLIVVTGMGLGAEQLGAEAAIEAGVPFVAILAYPEQDAVWPDSSRKRYNELLTKSMSTLVFQTKRPESRQQAGAALARRNGWLVKQADEAIVVWDGEHQLTGKLVRSLEDRLPDDVWIVRPDEP